MKKSFHQRPANVSPLLWRGCSRMPCGFVRPQVVVSNTDVYVGGGTCTSFEFSRTVLKYDSVCDSWSSLPLSPYYTFGLVLAEGHVTTVGGTSILSSMTTDKVCSFDESGLKKWCHTLPPMTTERSVCSAASYKDYIIVLGGLGSSDNEYLDSVEVLELSTKQWCRAASLPLPVTFMSTAVCSSTDQLYLLGGLSPREGAVRSVISCKIADLLTSRQPSDHSPAVWNKLTQVPFVRAGCAVIGGKLIISSGLEDKHTTSNTVQRYDPKTNSWVIVGTLPAARSSCSIAVLGGAQVMLVGGYVDPRNWSNSLTRDVMATVNLTLD